MRVVANGVWGHVYGGGVNRGHVSLFCAYVDTVYDCRVRVGASELLHRR